MVFCFYCGDLQTHRVCKPCYDAILEEEDKYCMICGEPKSEPVHDEECFK